MSQPSLSDILGNIITAVVSVIEAISLLIIKTAVVIGEILLFIGLFGKMTIIWTKVLTWFSKSFRQKYYYM
jgi:hypothetical protein